MAISESFWAEWTPRLLSVLRIVVALLFLQHGLTKLFGFPGAAPANFHWLTLDQAGRPAGSDQVYPVLEAPESDMCPGGLATTDAQ